MKFILIFAILYGLLPLLLYFKIKTAKINSILPFLVVVFVASLYEFIGTEILRINYENWYLIYKTLAFFGILYFFKQSIALKKLPIYFFCALYLIMMLLTFTVWKNEHYFLIGAYVSVLQTILVLLFSIVWFRQSFLALETASLWQNPNYYFVAGLNIYYFGTVFLFLSAKFMVFLNPIEFHVNWRLNIFLNIVLRTLLLVGVWKARVK